MLSSMWVLRGFGRCRRVEVESCPLNQSWFDVLERNWQLKGEKKKYETLNYSMILSREERLGWEMFKNLY